MTTEDFGKLWLSLANDVKQNIKMPSSQDSLSAALNTLQQKLKLHIVDVIGEWKYTVRSLATCNLSQESQVSYSLRQGMFRSLVITGALSYGLHLHYSGVHVKTDVKVHINFTR